MPICAWLRFTNARVVSRSVSPGLSPLAPVVTILTPGWFKSTSTMCMSISRGSETCRWT